MLLNDCSQIFFVDVHDADHGGEHKKAATPAPGTPTTGSRSGSTSAGLLHSNSAAVHPANPQQHVAEPQHHYIPRDFRRLWSADELEDIARWKLEEARIQTEREQHERVYMGFEDAIAYIVNERPRTFVPEEDVDAEDLIDDGEDEDEDPHAPGAGAISSDNSPWGILPPPRIDIPPNAVCKPEVPHGDVVHGEMASYFRIVEQLFDEWVHECSEAAFLWRAIYPQDAMGTPMYNPGGKYSVKLFALGKWRRIDIDDKLPVDEEGNIVYLTSSMRSEIWPALLTKALFKVVHWMRGNINESANGGDAEVDEEERPLDPAHLMNTVISALTGWKVSRWVSGKQKSASENALQQLLEVSEQYCSSSNSDWQRRSVCLTMRCG